MNERQLTYLLRLVDTDADLDERALEFRARLRGDLGRTLGETIEAVGVRVDLDRQERRPRRTGQLILLAAAAVLVVIGGFVVVSRQTTDAPASPTRTTPVPTTVAVLGPDDACERFRASAAFSLLVERGSEQTPAALTEAENAIDVLLADMRAAMDDEPPAVEPDTLDAIEMVRNVVREARLRAEAGDTNGVDDVLDVARLEFAEAGAGARGPFDPCLR